MADESTRIWLMAEHAALSVETAVVALGPASQDQDVAELLVSAAILRKTADDLFLHSDRVGGCRFRRNRLPGLLCFLVAVLPF
jgi:hypothetical protein